MDIADQKEKTTTLICRSILIAIVITLSTCIPIGYSLSIINAPANFMIAWCEQTLNDRGTYLDNQTIDILWASIVSILMIGGAIGSFIGGWIANKYGRKFAILSTCVFNVIATLFFGFCRLAGSIEMLIIGRFFAGIASGISMATSIMYLIEISPIKLRGPIGACMAIGITTGVLIGQIISIEEILGSEQLWHIGLIVPGVLSLFGILFSPLFPESPKYLYIFKGDKKAAEKVLKQLKGTNSLEIETELQAMQNELQLQSIENQSFKSIITDRSLWLPTVLICTLLAGQQLSGINAVFFYSVSLFEEIGFQSSDAEWINISFGAFNCATSFVVLFFIAKYHRRTILIISTSCCFIFFVILVICTELMYLAEWLAYVSIILIIGFILTFCIGFGPIPYFIAAELVESGPRSIIQAMGSFSFWISNFIVGMTFPILNSTIGSYTFLIYAIFSALTLIMVWLYLPETRGTTPSEIAQIMKDGFKKRYRKQEK